VARDRTVDLTEDTAFTLVLLEDTLAWRQRLVEQIELSQLRARVRCSYQVEIPPLTVEPFLEGRDAELVKVLLPLTTRPKRLLTGFDLCGPNDSPAHLLPRSSIAAIEAEYVGAAARSSPAADAAALLDADFLTALCVFTPGLAKEVRSEDRPANGRYGAFLEAGLGFDVPRPALRRWRALELRVSEVICDALGEPHDWLSSAEQPALALPFMEHPPADVAQVDEQLERFLTLVEALYDADDAYLLALIGEYGRRWEMIIETALPLNEPATIRMAEDRPMDRERWGWSRHEISLGDAASYHAEVTVNDANLEFVGEPSVRTLHGDEIDRPYIEGARLVRGSVAIYSSHSERPYYGELRCRLRPSRDLRYATRGVVLILIPALLLGLFVDPASAGGNVTGEMGVVAVATTLAVALLLIRESTPLASALLRTSRALVLGGMLAVWSVVLLRIAGWAGL
jgi:hypothetical protein